MTCIFQLSDGWYAMYQGRLSTALFNSRGAAEAWVSSCIAAGKWISDKYRLVEDWGAGWSPPTYFSDFGLALQYMLRHAPTEAGHTWRLFDNNGAEVAWTYAHHRDVFYRQGPLIRSLAYEELMDIASLVKEACAENSD